MNELRLKEYNADCVIYFYQPEGKGKAGEVGYFFNDDQAIVIQRAEEDTTVEHYGFKACKKIKEYVKENNLPIKGIQAWY